MGKDSHLIQTYSTLEMKIVISAWVFQESIPEGWPVGFGGSGVGIDGVLV
jgi:hypothetical protein